ncbi:hypothetical protein D3C73_1502090 [compost metagenome]
MDQLFSKAFIHFHTHIPDIDIHDIRLTFEGITPYQIQQRLAMHQPVFVGQETVEQLKFALRQFNVLTRAAYTM